MITKERLDFATQIKLKMEESVPVKEWGYSVKSWAGGECVRVYLNNKKNKSAGYVEISDDLSIKFIAAPGESMARNEIKALLNI